MCIFGLVLAVIHLEECLYAAQSMDFIAEKTARRWLAKVEDGLRECTLARIDYSRSIRTFINAFNGGQITRKKVETIS